jgi:hypothetical protein
MVRKYGQKKGERLIRELLSHYQSIAVIDTGTGNPGAVVRKVESLAALLGLPVSVVPGNPRLIEGLIAGNWSGDEYLVIPPGQAFTFADALTQCGGSPAAD